MAIKYYVFIFFLSIPLPFFAQNKTVVVKNGVPQFSIIVPVDSAAIERRAAVLLQSTIKKMAGCELNILNGIQSSTQKSIYIIPSSSINELINSEKTVLQTNQLKKHFNVDFESKRKLLIEDAFLISTQADNILIVSGGKKGSIYGVVHLLEKYLGCRMYAPNEELIPQRATITLPLLCELEKPVNTIRIVNGDMTQQNQQYRDWHRLNDHNEEFAKGFYVHTFNRLVPWETYFEKHPEYFALMGNKRIIDQLCLTNPDVYDLTVKTLNEEMTKQPEKKIVVCKSS
ncbi:DUF4838 domain-containing protein [Sediminibacterium sp.]|uniref:DUF4838 domain-containing protein n=1 Tax=Sediminibacterium sp. TaxID=1917865 RepID=UPI0025EF8542|nr:DUF4838 domain-containing protein [Sediminibacterium sp.]